MGKVKLITDEQRRYITAHMNDEGLSRMQLAEDAGVCISSLYRIIRESGGRIDHHYSKKQEGAEYIIRKYWPHYTAREIEQMQPEGYRFGKTTIIRWAQRLGVKHTEETEQRLRREQRERLKLCHNPESHAKIGKRQRLLRRMETLRVMSGMPKQTKLPVRIMPKRAKQVEWQLSTKYGYIVTTKPYLLWYDDNTKRIKEQYYIDKYGFSFARAMD